EGRGGGRGGWWLVYRADGGGSAGRDCGDREGAGRGAHFGRVDDATGAVARDRSAGGADHARDRGGAHAARVVAHSEAQGGGGRALPDPHRSILGCYGASVSSHPEERSAGPRLEGWTRAPCLLLILRDGRFAASSG